MLLSELKAGDKALVKSFDDLTAEVRKKLMIMGLLPKTELRLIRKAPMGDPLMVEVRGVGIALRLAIAEKIMVEESA